MEGFGIALADHIRIRIIVKDPDQLPGIPVGPVAVYCRIVILDPVTDLRDVGFQLGRITFRGMCGHDRIHCRPCRGGCTGFCGIRHMGCSVHGKYIRHRKAATNRTGEPDPVTDVGGPGIFDLPASCFIKPVHLIGHIIHQGKNEVSESRRVANQSDNRILYLCACRIIGQSQLRIRKFRPAEDGCDIKCKIRLRPSACSDIPDAGDHMIKETPEIIREIRSS